MEFAQGDLFALLLQGGISEEGAGPGPLRRGEKRGEREGVRERERRNKETEMDRGGGERA